MVARDYKAERLVYYGHGPVASVTPLQQLHRREMASRQAARRTIQKERGGKLPTMREVDHKDGNPLNNARSNLQVISRHANRSKH